MMLLTSALMRLMILPRSIDCCELRRTCNTALALWFTHSLQSYNVLHPAHNRPLGRSRNAIQLLSGRTCPLSQQ